MTVLVTGASGMLGRAVAEQLLADGEEVRCFQRRPSGVRGARDHLGSIEDSAAVTEAVQECSSVVHLAAKVSFTGTAADFDRINVVGTRCLLDAARKAGVGDVVYVSSPSVAHSGSSLVGAPAGPADPTHARGHYARTKAAAELLALARSSPGFRVAAVRPHIVWGPGDTQLVERVIQRARQGRLPLLDGGTALIDTTYVDNAAVAIVACLRRMHQAQGRALVVTNGEPRPIAELLAGICRAGGVAPPRWSVPGLVARGAGAVIERAWLAAGRSEEPPMTRFLAEQLSTAHWFDQRATREVLDWTPAVDIEEGLRRLESYYRR
ncbi:NAD-dependent epimerase/dehydratase family protein [Arthrobacter echini]|uniref:NAD-dependent epimerase/dehydratase family protein n=1 Tax=Arthrobacter echini TaxID=1529066 RepID=A0A4S5E5Y4_9MICC|nr:NAD-dependent epimerase/dehydratase family protein [Arthrobacter echini]THJ66944.1 NAD-dependent epimerase/dehydratase family protein [Arthrobacter echini]